MVEALPLIPDADCCSETEWEPEQIKHEKTDLVWRSQPYKSFLHLTDRLSFKYKVQVDGIRLATKRFDQCRIGGSTHNPNAAVCSGLPENCYDPVWYESLDYDTKARLDRQPPSDLLNTLPEKIERLLL